MTAPLAPTELLTIAYQRLQSGDIQAADNFIGMVLEKHPGYAKAWLLRALLALSLGQIAQAGMLAETCRRCADKADHALHADLGNLFRQLGRPEDAQAAYQMAITLNPGYAQGWSNMGVNEQELGNLPGAEAAYLKALSLDERLPLAHNNYAALRQQLGDLPTALKHFHRAIELDPNYAIAWKNYASILESQLQFSEALTAYERAAMARPHYAEALSGAVNMCLQRVEWDGLDARITALVDALQRDPTARISPFVYNGLESDPASQQQIAMRWASSYQPTTLPRRPLTAQSRIRLGYLGGDFFAHATSWLTAGLFAGHDRNRFEVFGYDYGRDDGSTLRQRIHQGFDRFVAVHALNNAELAQRIHNDEIDILIDLKGWTRGNRAEVLAWRPAPVQVHYLGYPGTLGADWCDYLIADQHVVPHGAEQYFSEAIVRLPHCYQINDRQREIGPPISRAIAGLPDGAIVFCCFNQHYKLLPGLFDIWMQILHAVPGSVLWLMEMHPQNRQRLLHEASRRGIAAERLVFAQVLPQADHLARLALADLVFDTLPYNAHTTASDALWAGVPLLTCVAESFGSRVAASCLHAVGLSELITQSLQDYRQQAIELGSSPQQLSHLRAKLAAQREHYPLFDTEATVKALEVAYERMWKAALAGQAPTGFDITAGGGQMQ